LKRVTIGIDSELDLKIRKKASQKYQFEKGWYSKAVAEAMELWATEDTSSLMNLNTLMNSMNPKIWEKLKSELNINEETPFENMESILNYFNQENDHTLKIDRDGDNMVIELKNNDNSDIEKNLETLMILHIILKIIISSLEETTKNKFEISGMGSIPPVYIKRSENNP